MTREEAKAKLNEVIEWSKFNRYPYVDDHEVEAIKVAIEALERTEPQGVFYKGDGYGYYDGELVYDLAECPECGYEYEEGDKDWGLPFCPKCGQALEWEVEDDQR